jgi:dihydroorotase
MSNMAQTLILNRPDDWHLHLRDGAALRAVVAASARQFARAIIMPNLQPPVTTTAQALAYRERILSALQAAMAEGSIEVSRASGAIDFQPLMTLYLTEQTEIAEIRKAKASGLVHAVKLYPAGATTHSDAGVADIRKVYPVLEAMQREGLPLLIHGEVTDPEVDLFDREAVFIDRVLIPLRQALPGLRIVFEHITTAQAAQYVREASGSTGANLAATITAQHLLYNRNAIFLGGMRPHWYCLPVLKREEHRLALLEAATSGSPKFFLGTDSAPHARKLKEHASGCAGCYTAPHALELYATAFEMAGKLDRLQGFACEFGAHFYRLPMNDGHVRLQRETWTVPQELPFPGDSIVPLAAGETLHWRLLERAAVNAD